MPSPKGFTGIAFPFHFSAKGGIATSTTSATDFSHIRESISQIIRTQLKERVMELEFGTDSKSLLFEPISGDTTLLSVAKFNVEQALKMWEPRINIDKVTVYVDPNDQNNLVIGITYTVVQYRLSDSVSISINTKG